MLKRLSWCIPLLVLAGCGGSEPVVEESPQPLAPVIEPTYDDELPEQSEPPPASAEVDPFPDPTSPPPVTTDGTDPESGPQLLPPRVDDPEGAAALTIPQLDWVGVQKKVQEHQGKVVMVSIWTTTCLTCLREYPHLAELAVKHPEDVALVAVNCDYDGIATKPPEFYLPQVKQFLAGKPMIVENVLLTVSFLEILEQLELNSTPAVFVYDREGKLAKRFDNDDVVNLDDEFTHADVATLVETLIASP